MDDVGPSTTRRALLAGASVGATSALAGCWERLWSQAETASPEQVSVTIKTVPADDDKLAAAIASQLRENYRAAGIEASHEPVTEADLYRDVLLEDDYDVFVARHSGLDDCDALYGLLHSRFNSEQGWQNPFHFTDVTADEYLEDQRSAAEDERGDVLADLIEHLHQTVPYTVVAYPHAICGVHDRLGSVPAPPRRPHEYMRILAHEGYDRRDRPLEIGVYGEELTERLNPLTVDRNRIDGLLGLLYDPLARRIDDVYVPWLAEDVEWDQEGRLTARVSLREGLEWHDGEPLVASDVAFTLDLLTDTSMGAVEDTVPAPRFRSRRTLIDGVELYGPRTFDLAFVDTTREVARRALTIPVLPEHVWAERSELVADRHPEALAHDNDDPVGSGLFATGEASGSNTFELEPFDDHVFRGTTDRPSVLEGFSRFEGLRFRIAPNPGALIEALDEGEIDVTASGVPPSRVGEIRESTVASTVSEPTDDFYLIGYNHHHPELGNPHFRRICSKLIDRDHAVDEPFEGFAEVPRSPNGLVGIHDDVWEADGQFVDHVDPDLLSFPGTDGEVDPVRARDLFREIHYSYENGDLIE